ncbi:hypothetical protein [Aliiglaciecola litoralis]|uniref:Uncharacterized protein n=1 Tax=Aliiglaciecola litoralis TaxID=582857 RepID=A0ABN1LQ92_9ALTE
MKYPIQDDAFAENALQIEIPGLFTSPRLLLDEQSVHPLFSNKHAFHFNDPNDKQRELTISLPWLDPAIRVNLDGEEFNLNTVHSAKARLAIFVPLAVMVLCLVLSTFSAWIAIALMPPLSLLAVRAMRLNHFSKKRKLLLAAAMLVPLTLLAATTWKVIERSWENRVPAASLSRHVFYDVVLSSEQFAFLSRQGVVDLLDAFRTTQAFESVELDLAELPVAPELEVSISQSFYPKVDRKVWIVRFDFTTAELGVVASQDLANSLGSRFEDFLRAIEN